MEIKTFDTILAGMCDSFDALISPKVISRSNTNIIYLILKAIAKGFEIINNVCVVLSNKFDPASCSSEDLESVAYLVGTDRLQGSGSGLHILIHNNSDSTVTILQGTYTYELDADTIFSFEILENTEIEAGSYITVIAMSETIGSYPVTAQDEITVTADVSVPDGVTFSCTDNSSLLGTSAESDLAFRKRILEGYDNQDSIIELQSELKNLPYLFDCCVKYNNTLVSVDYDGITVPPFTALIFYSGSPKNEIAEVIASRILCPTVQTEDSVAVEYDNETFINGKHVFYITPFGKADFAVDVIYKVNALYISQEEAESTIRTALINSFVSEVHKDYVKEDDVYNVIEELNITGVEVLSINLKQNGEAVNYVTVPASKVPHLTEVTFSQGA